MVYLSFVVSVLAFILSGTVAWFTLLRRGRLRMTTPAFVAFGHDVGPGGRRIPKIFIKALLYSTGKRGYVVESMFLRVQHAEKEKKFSIWGHGEEKLSRGGGLFVGETGMATNHHFNPPDGDAFAFVPGAYHILVFATLPTYRQPVHLQTIELEIPNWIILPAEGSDAAIWFDWQPNQRSYLAHAETRSGGTGIEAGGR